MHEYSELELPLVTTARVAILVTDIVSCYLFNQGMDDEEWPEEPRRSKYFKDMAYPMDLGLFFEEVIRQISLVSLDGSDEDIYSGNGNIYIEKVARILRAQRRIQRASWMSFHSEAEKYKIDLLALNYAGLDYSRPHARIAISLFYLTGFLILLYPPVTTMASIVYRSIL